MIQYRYDGSSWNYKGFDHYTEVREGTISFVHNKKINQTNK